MHGDGYATLFWMSCWNTWSGSYLGCSNGRDCSRSLLLVVSALEKKPSKGAKGENYDTNATTYASFGSCRETLLRVIFRVCVRQRDDC